MAITVKHSKVSTIPDGDDTSVVRPSDWNADHQLVGTIPVDNGGTGASTLTGYVKGNGTSTMTASSTIPNTDITGLGTASTKDAGVANGVATLDGSGTVPISQLPAAVLGALSYQGTWNASTNTPTLTSSVGTKGYYYVVSVAGSTNLNGITDWQVGDWAVYNGTAWQKIDNTDAVTSVNGHTGTVVLSYSDVGAFPATATTGTGSVVLQTSPTINTPTLSGATVDGSAPYMNYTPTTAPTYVEGRVFYDSSAHTLNYYNDNSQMSLNIGQEEVIRVRNQTGSTIANGTVVYVNGATGNTPTIALAIATSFSTSDIIGVATTDIANNGFGYVTISGLVNGLDLSAFADGNPVFLSATTAGALTTTEPVAPNYSVQVGVVLRANPSVGTLLVATQQISVEVAHIVGQIQNSQLQNSTITINGNSTALGGSVSVGTVTSVAATAGTGISVSGSPITTSGTLTITNTAPDQTVVLTAGTGISTSGTYPNFTITNTSPSSGGTVTSVAALTLGTTGTDLSSTVANSTTTPVITLNVPTASATNRGALSAADWSTFNGKYSVGGALGTPSSGTVTNLTGTASININGTVGATTANTGAFTTLSASSTVSGTGFSTYLASPPAIGGTTAAAITGTTITATKYVGVSGGIF